MLNGGRCLINTEYITLQLIEVKDIADEIIVVDSSSSDNTAVIALSYNARVIVHHFMGYGVQKNFATQQATNDWILSLDADEALTPELRQSILEIKKGPASSVYQMSRLTNYCGKWIRHCGWYPQPKLRFFNKNKFKINSNKVHESVVMYDNKARIGRSE